MSRNTDSNTAEIAKGIEIIDLALYLPEEKILILADMHIGIEESLVRQGTLIPKFHFKDLADRVQRIFSILDSDKKKVKLVVINGDLKHEFGRISDEEWRNTLKMLDYLLRKVGKVVLVKGNHDNILGPIAEKRNVMLVDEFIVGDVLICHGDKIPEILTSHSSSSATPGSAPRSHSTKRATPDGASPVTLQTLTRRALRKNGGGTAAIKTIIIGHDHPAVSIYDNLRKETFKAFIVGKHERKTLIVQPSLNPMTEGTDVKKERLLSPFLQKDLGNFDVYVVADEVYHFGKLKKI